MAGLLAFSVLTAFPLFKIRTVAKDVKTLYEITASGNAPVSHRIPFYFKPMNTV